MLLSELIVKYAEVVRDNMPRAIERKEVYNKTIQDIGEFVLRIFVSGVSCSNTSHYIDIVKRFHNGYEVVILWTKDLSTFNNDCKIDCTDPSLTVKDLLIWIQAQNMDWSDYHKADSNKLMLDGMKVEKIAMVSRTKRA